MPNDRYMIWCPFFLFEDQRKKEIVCEGIVPMSTSRQRFGDPRNMSRWMHRVCSSEDCGKRCMLARAQFEFYRGEVSFDEDRHAAGKKKQRKG